MCIFINKDEFMRRVYKNELRRKSKFINYFERGKKRNI